MRVSKSQQAEHHEDILRSAGRLFREKGFDGAGVAELMKSAGLTNGAFYGHFASKEELIAQSCERAIVGPRSPWASLDGEGYPISSFLDDYLSVAHASLRGGGCLFGMLSGDVSRQTPLVRSAYTANLIAQIGVLQRAIDEKDEDDARERALATLCTMVGALMLARAVDDPSLSGEMLTVARGRCEQIVQS